jgi:hypothetical protein
MREQDAGGSRKEQKGVVRSRIEQEGEEERRRGSNKEREGAGRRRKEGAPVVH